MATHENSSFRGLVRISPGHDEDPDQWLAVDSVVDAFEPALEPAQSQRVEINRRGGAKLRLARVAPGLSAVGPRPHDQSLRALLGLGQLDVAEVRHLRAPRI